MSFIATPSPDEAYVGYKRLARQIRSYSVNRSSEFGSATNRDVLLDVLARFVEFRTTMDTLTATPGLAAYAQAQESNPSYDVVAEHTALRTALNAVIAEIRTSFPVSNVGGKDYLLMWVRSATVTEAPTMDTFTAPQLATVAGLLDAVVAAITV